MKRKISLATLFFLGVLPLAAIAAEPTPGPGTGMAKDAPAAKDEPAPLFEQLDLKHDGYVTTLCSQARTAATSSRP